MIESRALHITSHRSTKALVNFLTILMGGPSKQKPHNDFDEPTGLGSAPIRKLHKNRKFCFYATFKFDIRKDTQISNFYLANLKTVHFPGILAIPQSLWVLSLVRQCKCLGSLPWSCKDLRKLKTFKKVKRIATFWQSELNKQFECWELTSWSWNGSRT